MFEFPQKTESVTILLDAIKNEKSVIHNLWSNIQQIQ